MPASLVTEDTLGEAGLRTRSTSSGLPTSAANPSSPSLRAGQKQLWDSGLALQGPDTDTLRGDNRNGIHFSGTTASGVFMRSC